MKFKIFKLTIRIWDFLVALALVGYFFFKPFRVFIDNLPYLGKAVFWLLIVLFFYYSIVSWVKLIKKAAITVLQHEESLESEELVEDIETISEDSISDENIKE